MQVHPDNAYAAANEHGKLGKTDAWMILDTPPGGGELVYGIKPGDPLVTDRSFIEVPLGEGGVPFPAYLKALDEIGYHGFLTIEREVGGNPTADIEKAVRFLRALI